jgi:hypothetical protein
MTPFYGEAVAMYEAAYASAVRETQQQQQQKLSA